MTARKPSLVTDPRSGALLAALAVAAVLAFSGVGEGRAALPLPAAAASLALAAAATAWLVLAARRFARSLDADGAATERPTTESRFGFGLALALAAGTLALEGVLDALAGPKAYRVAVIALWGVFFAVFRLSALPAFRSVHTVTLVLCAPLFLVVEPGPSRLAWNAIGMFLMLVTIFGAQRDVERARERERTRLLRRLSHDLRTPAAGIRSLAEALERGDVREESERARCLALIRGEAERLSLGLERMLRAARGEARSAPSVVPLDLAEWARAAALRWRTRLPGLRVLAPEALPGAADPEMLDEAMDALLDNAMRHGGPAVTLEVSGRGGAVSVAVADDGPGPVSADPARLAGALRGELVEGEPGDAAGQKGGYGLGIWAAGEVARAHGGSIALEPPSRFVIALPRASGDPAEEREAILAGGDRGVGPAGRG